MIVTTEILNPKETFLLITFPQQDLELREVTATYYNNKVAKDAPPDGTRNEFRLTRWGGSECPLQDVENTGALIIFAFRGNEFAQIWVCSDLEEETEAENWLGETVEPQETLQSWDTKEAGDFDVPRDWLIKFPTAEEIFAMVLKLVQTPSAAADPDKLLCQRRSVEFELFRFIEKKHVMPQLSSAFRSVDEFIDLANSVTNRRKSRSGKSLELGLGAIFEELEIPHETQVVTENNSRPDFIFPSLERYVSMRLGKESCLMLAAKTCCKDRWRQITKEARKIKTKHLFTLQEGVSSNQLAEMRESGVQLVVPKSNFTKFPPEWRPKLICLKEFAGLVKGLQ